MKKIICIFLLVLSSVCYSQDKMISSYSIQNKNELLSDSTLMRFLNKLNINVSDYDVVGIYDYIDTIAMCRSKNNKFTLKKYQINYTSLEDSKISYVEKITNNDTKKQDKKKFLSCFKTLELNDNKEYNITFFILES